MNQLLRLVLLPMLVLFSGCANSVPFPSPTLEGESSPAGSVQPFNYDDYEAVLKTYVNDLGLVNYQKLQANRGQLERFVAAVGAVTPHTYKNWNEKEKIAFLINAYNAFTLKSIIDQSPLKSSIRDIPGVWKWRQFKIAGQSKTLDNIEHNTLRVNFNEPRIHVALVCAAISCPILRNEPYTAAKLDTQLDEQVRKFLASPHGFRLEIEKGQVYLSSIYKWYGSDWEKSYGGQEKFTGNKSERAVLNFLSRYLSPPDREYLERGNYQIRYLDYDWSLNKQ